MIKIKYGMDGWNAQIAKDFTYESVRLVTQGIATYVKSHNLNQTGIAVGYDNRFLSEEFSMECAEVLIGNGIKVHLFKKPVPIPLLAFAIHKLKLGGGLMVTASHYAPTMNGIRFLTEQAGPAMPYINNEIEQDIDKAFASNKYYQLALEQSKGLDLSEEIELDKEYVQQLLKLSLQDGLKNREQPLKVVIDPMFGSALGYLDKILIDLNCEVKTINNYRDAMFGNTIPSPLDSSLADLKRAVISYKADMGFALDGDGDNYVVVDQNGEVVESRDLTAMLLYYLLKTRSTRGPVCRTIATSHCLDNIARENGLSIIETPVGFSYISEAIQQKSCLLGVEESGGLTVMGHIPYKDGILACLLAAEMLAANEGKTLSDLQNELEVLYGLDSYEQINISSNAVKMTYIKQKLENWNPTVLAGEKVVNSLTTEQDGKKLVLESGNWLLIRASSTEECYRICIEARDGEALQRIREELFTSASFLKEEEDS